MRAALLLSCLVLAGCGPDDFSRPGTWQATGINDANLRAMLADPRHAVGGVGAATDRGEPGVAAIERLNQDRRRPLPDSRAAMIGSAPAASAPAPAMGGSGAN